MSVKMEFLLNAAGDPLDLLLFSKNVIELSDTTLENKATFSDVAIWTFVAVWGLENICVDSAIFSGDNSLTCVEDRVISEEYFPDKFGVVFSTIMLGEFNTSLYLIEVCSGLTEDAICSWSVVKALFFEL